MMRVQYLALFCVMMFGLVGCQQPCEAELYEFENEESDVEVYHLQRTMKRLETDQIAEISCEDFCYTIEGGEYSIDYEISDCAMELDPEIIDIDVDTADAARIVGTVRCTGFIVNPCK